MMVFSKAGLLDISTQYCKHQAEQVLCPVGCFITNYFYTHKELDSGDSVEGERLIIFKGGPKEANLTLEEGEGILQSNYTSLPRGEYE
jgi:hypothetical protein